MSGGKDFATMTDDEFEAALAGDTTEHVAASAKTGADVVEVDPKIAAAEADQAAADLAAKEAEDAAKAAAADTPGSAEPEDVPAADADGGTADAEPTAEETAAAEAKAAAEQKALYESIIGKPIKAASGEITLRTPEEVLSLLQRGVDYTQKTQQLAGQRKIITMLQANGLDEAQINYAIDLIVKKDPKAIARLVKDAEVNPLDIDVESSDTYRAGNHSVSDEQVVFDTVLDDIRGSSAGQSTIDEALTWDQASLEVLWKNPEILRHIHAQKTSGVYDAVKGEMDRRIRLGALSENVPFIQAYHDVGQEMAKAAVATPPKGQDAPGAKADQAPAGQPGNPLGTKAGGTGSAVKDDKAAAAAQTRGSGGGGGGKAAVDFSKMSDAELDEYLKKQQG